MKFLKKYGFYFLLLGVLSDFLTPYILGIFYPELNQMTRVMSVFGDVASPVRGAFLVWATVSGRLFILSLPRFIRALLKLRGLWRFCLLLRLVCMGLAIVFLRGCLVLIRSRRVGRFRLGFIILARGLVMRDF